MSRWEEQVSPTEEHLMACQKNHNACSKALDIHQGSVILIAISGLSPYPSQLKASCCEVNG